jgi:hypothetical protein
MYDTIDGTRDTYQCSYTLDEANKTATFADDCVKVILTTEITVSPDPVDSSSYTSPKDLSAHQSQENPMTTPATATPATQGTPAPAPTAAPVTNTAAALPTPEFVAAAKPAMTPEEQAAYDKAQKAKNNETVAPAVQAASAAPLTAEQYLAMAPPGVREALESGMRMHSQHKTQLIEKIKGNSRNKFSVEQLTSFDVPTLENLAELAFVPDYSGVAPAGGFQANVTPPAENPNFAPTPPRLFTANATSDTPRGVMKAAS